MPQDSGSDVSRESGTGETADGLLDWSRRTLLKVSGVGVAGLGGAGLVAAQEDDENGGDEGENGEETGEDGTDEGETGAGSDLVDDLVDPMWGYPLSADESDDVSVEHVVELASMEGPGAHANFPQQAEAEGEFPAEFVFDPVGIQVAPGDVVEFLVVSGEHTVTAYHDKFTIPQRATPHRVPEGVPGFTSPPILTEESWLYQFDTKGVYDLLCLPHLTFGMVMRVVVFDPEEDDVEDDTFAAPTAGELLPNPQLVFAAPELDPANIVEAGTVAWADLTLGEQPSETEMPGNETEMPGNETEMPGNETASNETTQSE